MHDIDRDAMRDRLPDLLHGQLPEVEATALERAVLADAELSRELAVLRRVEAALHRAPAVDIAAIVRALPAAPSPVVAAPIDELAVRRAAKRPWISTRFARAAAVLVVVGGGTMVSVWGGRDGSNVAGVPPIAVESIAAGSGAMQLGLGTSTDELSVEQLRALEADIRSLDGLPSDESDAGHDLFDGEGAS
jgi:anti-sigma factor RsiW